MVKAIYDGVVLAESDDVRRVEGMTYFPSESVDSSRLEPSKLSSRCFWKGKATYWDVTGENTVASAAAFTYERPWPLARRLVSGRIAFWRDVQIVEDP
jgi:uncharacterized protein (DUF427 family)